MQFTSGFSFSRRGFTWKDSHWDRNHTRRIAAWTFRLTASPFLFLVQICLRLLVLVSSDIRDLLLFCSVLAVDEMTQPDYFYSSAVVPTTNTWNLPRRCGAIKSSVAPMYRQLTLPPSPVYDDPPQNIGTQDNGSHYYRSPR